MSDLRSVLAFYAPPLLYVLVLGAALSLLGPNLARVGRRLSRRGEQFVENAAEGFASFFRMEAAK